eukprot:9213935-Ditylum_brightwellii.AAC.1
MSSLEYAKIERHSLVPFEKTFYLAPCFIWTKLPLAVNVASLFDSGKCILVQYVAVAIVAVIIAVIISVVVSIVIFVVVAVVVTIVA